MEGKFCSCWSVMLGGEHEANCPSLALNPEKAAAERTRGIKDWGDRNWSPPTEVEYYKYYEAGYYSPTAGMEDQLMNL